MKFQTALEWLQVDEDETEKFMNGRAGGSCIDVSGVRCRARRR